MEGWNYELARSQILAFKERVVSHKNRIDYCLRHYAKIIGVATRKRDDLVKELETLRGESEKLDRAIAAMGLIDRFKMLQLKLKYQMEINNSITEHQLEIIRLTLTQKKAIRKIRKLKELRTYVEIYIVHSHYLLRKILIREIRLQRRRLIEEFAEIGVVFQFPVVVV